MPGGCLFGGTGSAEGADEALPAALIRYVVKLQLKENYGHFNSIIIVCNCWFVWFCLFYIWEKAKKIHNDIFRYRFDDLSILC